MTRNTEPTLTPSDEMDSEQRKALRLFTKVTEDTPSITSSVIRAFTELSQANSPIDTTEAQRLAARAVRQMLETGADLEASPDPETAEAMRRAIASAESAHSPENRRLARLGAFAISVQTWQEQQAAAQLPEAHTAQHDDSSAA